MHRSSKRRINDGGLDTDGGGFCWDAAAGRHTADGLALPDTSDSQDGTRLRALIFLADSNWVAVSAIRFLLEAAGPARSQDSHQQRDADDEEDERLVGARREWWRH
jgi:hypothetical protein